MISWCAKGYNVQRVHRLSRPRRAGRSRLGCFVWGVALGMGFGCMRGDPYAERDLKPQSDRPQISEAAPIAPYEGQDRYVLEAQSRLPTGIELHRKVIWRTCTPNDGVCHNRKEYPELRTPAALIAAFDAPCNVQAGEAASVFDACETRGDGFVLDSWASKSDRPMEVGFLYYQAGKLSQEPDKNWQPNAQSPGFHVSLAGAIKLERNKAWGTGRFLRREAQGDFELISLRSDWWVYDGGKKLYARIKDYQRKQVEAILQAGIVQGDANRNGIFGARANRGVKMLVPGAPENSYMIARMRGEMHGAAIPGSRMPLANQPLTIAEMLALYCFVEGFGQKDKDTGLLAPIDYRNCRYSKDPASLNLLGAGVTWKGRISKILESHCGGCHGQDKPSGGLSLVGDGVYARLLEPSQQKPELALVKPKEAKNSYLYQKLIQAPGIVGLGMPIDSAGEAIKLGQAELGDILTWIENGAQEDQ